MNLLRLAADPSSDLNWENSPSKGTWFLDFSFQSFDPFDTALFNSHMLAVEEFSKRFPHAKKVVLAKSDGKFSKLFKPSEKLEARFKETAWDYELFCASIFSQYLHRLASVLPEETQPFIYFEIEEKQHYAELVLLLCKRRFEHFQLHFSHIEIPVQREAAIGVCLPQDIQYQAKTFQSLFDSLEHFSYKCIPEELLNEHWDGMDHLIIDPLSLGETGKRMLYGFEATGGQIITLGHPLGFENEISLEVFLKNRSGGI